MESATDTLSTNHTACSLSYGKGHKRFKLSNNERKCVSITCLASVNRRTIVLKVVDFSNLFII